MWEAEITSREAVSEEMFDFIQQSRSCDSNTLGLIHALADWAIVARQAGLRLGEYAHDLRSPLPKDQYYKLNIFGAAQAFTINDITFFGPKKKTLHFSHTDVITESHITTALITWRTQKNGTKNEAIWYARNKDDTSRCVVQALLRIRLRAQVLNIPVTYPLAVYQNDRSFALINNRHIEHTLQTAARRVHNISDKKKLSRYSSHSYRVMACVLLDTAGKSTDFIKFRLRWKSDAFKMYTRHTQKFAALHNAATTDCSFLI